MPSDEAWAFFFNDSCFKMLGIGRFWCWHLFPFFIQVVIFMVLGTMIFKIWIWDILGIVIKPWILFTSVPVGKGVCHLLTARWAGSLSSHSACAGRGRRGHLAGAQQLLSVTLLSCQAFAWREQAFVRASCVCVLVFPGGLLLQHPSLGYMKQRGNLRNALLCCSSGPGDPSQSASFSALSQSYVCFMYNVQAVLSGINREKPICSIFPEVRRESVLISSMLKSSRLWPGGRAGA